uniref:Protein kinase domain-containing protein n=1 Tax=Parascaris equorum TaxID=6256 RepID=A0A914RQT6_PAREQ
REQDEFVAEDAEAKRLAEHVKQTGVIDEWIVRKVIGAGANGLVALVENQKTNENAVMKIAMNLSTSGSLYWESDVLERIMQPSNNEDRTRHLVRRVDFGHTVNMDKQDVGYIVMENLPGNPVGILGALSGNALISKVAEFGLQLLKAVYDLHYLGFVHRDIKPENVGLYHDEILVLYDLGINVKNAIKLTGRVDDLWGWFYVLIEWMNCASKYPLCWAAFENDPDLRHFCKSGLFPAKYRYLRCLGRDDSPDYLYLAKLLLQAKKTADGTPAAEASAPFADEENDEKWSQRMSFLERLYD